MGYNNILVISDNEKIHEFFKQRLVLLRDSDSLSFAPLKDAKKEIQKSAYNVAILHDENNDIATIKLVKQIKENKPETEILLLIDNVDAEFLLKAYDAGIYDYITLKNESWELLIKVVNSLKFSKLKEENSLNKKMLYSFDVIDPKNGLYKYNYIKDIFSELNEDIRIQNGVFCILTLADKIKTKVSSNRLAQILKNNTRSDDITATARGGYFYIIFQNTDINSAGELISKIQNKMGDGYTIHAGLTKIGLESFESVEKNAKDSLKAAIQNNEMFASLTDNHNNGEKWLEDSDNNSNKEYKLFKILYEKKLDTIITPLFYRFQKECEAKLINTQVSQYTNKIECVFSLKNKKLHSELIIRHNGYTKIKIEITHSGLDSADNTKIDIPLNKFTEKELSKLLKQLKTEYKQG